MKVITKTYHIFCSFLLCLLFFSTNKTMAQATGYKYKKQMTIQASQVSSTQTDFPVLISITDTNLRDNVKNTNGYDIRFTSDAAGNTVLSEQIESYDSSTGKLVAWVKIPSLSSSANTSIYMFYDKTGVSANPSSNATWSSQYSSVYHFQNNLLDATGTANNGTNHNSTNTTTGKIGYARQFNGTSAYIQVSQDLSQVLGGNGSVSAWVKTTQTGNNTVYLAPGLTGIEEAGGGNDIFYGHINAAGRFGITKGNGNTAYSTNALNNNQWHYVVFTRNTTSGQVRTYVDGTLNNTATSETGDATNPFHSIGRIEDTGNTPEYYQGTIDEFRVSNQIFTQNQIQTSYNNQNNPANFYTVGAQQYTDTTPPGAPQNVSATALAGGTIRIAFNDVNESGGIQSGVGSYSVKRSPTSGGPYTQVGTVTDNESASYTYTDNTATNGTTYYYVVTAIDAATNESTNSSEVLATADGTAPALQTATVNGTALQLDYNETLDSGSVPAAGDYSVTVNGSSRSVTNVAISGDKVNLTLSSGAITGDNVKVSYTAGTHPVQDAVGNQAANLSGQSVTNNTADNTPPGAPQNVSAAALAGGSINITFDDVNETGSGVSSYSVKRSTTQGGPYTQVGTVTDNESASYTYTDNTATDGTTYYYVVTALDASSNESVNSAEVSATADGTAPALQTATVNGTALQLDYDEMLYTGSVPAVGDYSVTVNSSSRSITNVAISGDKVNLTLSSGVNPGDTITLNYTAGTHPVQDAVGNQAANLSGQSVTNQSDNTPPSLSSASINGSSLKLSYDEMLDAGSVPVASDYTVRVNGTVRTVDTIQLNGNIINLTLDPAVVSGDNIQVDYTAGSNPVQDVAGNDAANFTNQTVTNNTFSNSGFGPDPCPIVNGQDAGWACFDGLNNGTTMSAYVGDLKIATVDAASGSQTIFAPNALQEWDSGAFSGDQYNGPQANPNGNGNNATSFDITIPAGVPSDALILALNRLRPDGGGTSYTLEAFDGSNNKVTVNDWLTGQGTDGGVCTNAVNLAYANGNTTIDFQPTVSGNPSCAASSTPIWFRITDANVRRIEIRKTTSQPDNIYLGLAIVADFGDAPNTYGTAYSSRTPAPAFHLLHNGGSNPVHFGSSVDGDGNGRFNGNANGDDNDSGLDSGDDEDGASSLPDLTVADTQYSVTLSCTTGGAVGGWVDFNHSGTFEFNEFASGTCAAGSVTLTWSGLSGLVAGPTYARFRIATNSADVANPTGFAADGEVEDYPVTITSAAQTDLEMSKTVDNATPITGDTLSFTVKMVNNGPDNATGIKVTDQLPGGLTYLSSTPGEGTYNNSTGIWNIGNVSANDSTSLVITVKVNTGTSGQTITNAASVTAHNESDPNLSNNTASSGITVVLPATDIEVTKIVDNDNPNEGQYINFTINAINDGPRAATSLSIIDQLPTGLTFESASPNIGTFNSSTGIWTIGNLANGGTASLALQARVDAGTQGSTITNTAAVNHADQGDDNVNNNSVSVDVTVVPAGPPVCNQTPALTFQNPNLISGTAGQVGAVYEFSNVTTGVDAEVEIVTINNATLDNIDVTTVGANDNFQPQVEPTDATQTGYMDFEVRYKQHSNGNTAFLSFAASAVDVDGDGSGNIEYDGFQRLTSFTVENNTNLVIGSSGIYTTFTPATAANVTDIDVNNTQNLAYTTYTNEPQFRIRTGINNPQNNGAQQRYFSFNFDPCNVNLFQNPTSTNIVDVGINKSVDNVNPHTGDTINYTVSATNQQGNAVGNVEVTDHLPNGLTFVSATASMGTYSNSTGVWDIGNLLGQQSVNLTIKATVNNNQAGNTITNTATLSDHDGQDGNASNNSASAALSVYNPNATGCTEPPYFSFTNPVLETGSAGQAGAVYRFSNVRSGTDALVKITAIHTATLNNVDDPTLGNSTDNFSPLFTATSSNGYIDWRITFVQTGTSTPVKQNFALSALDIDGAGSASNGIKDYYGFAQNQSSIVQGSNNLTRTSGTPFETFESSDFQDGNGSFDPSRIAYIVYRYTSVLDIRTGSETFGGYQDDRLVDIDFRQCINQELTNPVTTTRDADIAVTKTTDNANPLAGETVHFTVTAHNNGPEDATELDIKEALPTGLTLVQATPSQGTYSQLNKIWSVGNLNASASATLTLETTVNSGGSADSLVNKAYVKGLNQLDPTAANDTAQVAIKISIPIKGTVFEDKTGDALTDGDSNLGDATGDQRAKQNVVVHLFKDGGDGVADGADDIYLKSDTTSSTGAYNLRVGSSGTYWVAVDSRSAGLSDGTTWPQQTYAPAGGLCTDGAGATTTRTSAGVCYGGRQGNVSDALPSGTVIGSDLSSARHVAKVTVNSTAVTGINFGFSYNVVTNISDGDDDTGAARSVQGSLRQFIQNANAISGANTMRFVPAVATNATGSGGAWWSITLNSALPAVTDALTTIDGKAYDLSNPTTERDTNPGSIGSGGTVGLDQLSLNTFEKKELEINLNDAGNNAFRINSSGAIMVRRLALYNNSRTLRISQISNGLVEKNFLGARADGTDPAGGLRAARGIGFNGSSSASVLIQQNYIAFAMKNGVESNNANAAIQLTQNEIYQNGLSNNQGDGIAGLGTWTIQQNLIYQNGNSNSKAVNGGSGIELGSTSGSTQNNQIKNNTIRNNATTGITVLNGVSGTLITKNIINNNGTKYTSGTSLGAGIKLTTPASQAQQGINITNNSFYTNYGLAIDAVKTYSGDANSGQADGVNPNDGALQSASSVPNKGLDYPVFTLATLNGSTLHIEGYVGTYGTHLAGPFTVEVYKADDDGNNQGLIETGGTLVRAHGEGKTLLGTITTNPNGTFSEDITVNGAANLAINQFITALAIGSSNNTSEFSSNQKVVPTGVTVTGYVYHDDNHNGTRENGEPGLQSVTVVLYNEQENNCKSVATDANGRYQFSNVLNGQYTLIEAAGQSIPTPDVCTPDPADPADHVSTTPNSRPLTVNNLPGTQNFGDFEGTKVQGKVFNDNGISSGTAHDVVQNGGEQGIDGTVIKALNGSGTTLAQTTTANGGAYILYIAKADALTGSTVKIQETNKGNNITIGGAAGTTAGTYSKTTDQTTYITTVGTSYSGVNFADVQSSSLLTDGQQNLLPGASGTFTHQFIAQTAGDVTFSISTVYNPSGANWPVLLYRDSNGNGSVDSGEPILDGSTSISVAAGQTVALIIKEDIPPGTSSGSSSSTTLSASFALASTSPTIQQTLTRIDLVHVTENNGGLLLTKAVDKAQALPGETLTYTITYTNNGTDPISSLKINDSTPGYTVYSSSSYGTLPDDLTNCSITTALSNGVGSIVWTFTGTLAPGATGTVSYQVIIQN